MPWFPPNGGRCEVRRAMVRRSWRRRRTAGASEGLLQSRSSALSSKRVDIPRGLPSAPDARAPLHVRPPREHASTTTATCSTATRGCPCRSTRAGRVAAAALGRACSRRARSIWPLHTRFARTRETLMLLLGRRPGVPVASSRRSTTSTSGSSRAGDVQAYRDWRALHGPEQAVPGGESRLGALARYADGCARLLARRDARCVLARRARRADPLPAQRAAGRGSARRAPCAPSRTSSA